MPDPQIIKTIALVIIFILLILTFKNNFYGLLAYLCISITSPGVYFPFLGKIRFEMVVALILLLVIILSQEGLNSLSLKRSPISRNLFLFFLVIIFSMIQALDFPTAYDRTWDFAKVYAFYFMIIALIKTDRELKIFLLSFGILMAWIGYEPIYNFLHGEVIAYGETTYAVAETGRGSGHVALGIYLLQGLPFLWYLTVSNQNIKGKLIGLFPLIICFIALIISGSRGAMIGLVMMILLIAYFSNHKILYLLSGGFIIMIALLSMGSGYLSHMRTVLEFGQSDLSAHSRVSGLINGIDMLIKRPLLGVGPGCYPVARKLWFGWGMWSHNIYGQLAGDLGFAGIIVWIIFLYSYLKKCFVMRKSLNRDSLYYGIINGLIVSNIVSLVLGFFAHTLYGYFWCMSAAVVVVMEDLLIKRKAEMESSLQVI